MKKSKGMLVLEIAFSALAFVGTLGSTILGWKEGQEKKPKIQDKSTKK